MHRVRVWCGVPAHRLDVSVYEMACVQRVHPFQKLVGYLQNCVFVRTYVRGYQYVHSWVRVSVVGRIS